MNTTELELAEFLENYLYVPGRDEILLHNDNLEIGYKIETLTLKGLIARLSELAAHHGYDTPVVKRQVCSGIAISESLDEIELCRLHYKQGYDYLKIQDKSDKDEDFKDSTDTIEAVII